MKPKQPGQITKAGFLAAGEAWEATLRRKEQCRADVLLSEDKTDPVSGNQTNLYTVLNSK